MNTGEALLISIFRVCMEVAFSTTTTTVRFYLVEQLIIRLEIQGILVKEGVGSCQ